MNNRLSFFLVIFLFMIDICFFSFFQQHMLAGLTCLYIILLFEQLRSIPLSFIALFLSLESLAQYNNLLTIFAYIAPATLIILMIKQLLYTSRIQPYIVLAGVLIAQSLYFNSYIPHLTSTISYTTIRIIANIIMMMILSLKLKLKAS